MTAAIVIAVIVAVAIVIGLLLRSRGSADGVDTFRRQIDALSAEARKPTVDQVKSAERPADVDGSEGPNSAEVDGDSKPPAEGS